MAIGTEKLDGRPCYRKIRELVRSDRKMLLCGVSKGRDRSNQTSWKDRWKFIETLRLGQRPGTVGIVAYSGALLSSLVGARSPGVVCGLEGESILSGLPLPHESSRRISAESGRLGLASEPAFVFLKDVRTLEGEAGSS
jgi:hypothetical protein